MNKVKLPYTCEKFSLMLKLASEKAHKRCKNNSYLRPKYIFTNELTFLLNSFVKQLPNYLFTDKVLKYRIQPNKKSQDLHIVNNKIDIKASYQYYSQANLPYRGLLMKLMCRFVLNKNKLEFIIMEIPLEKEVEKTISKQKPLINDMYNTSNVEVSNSFNNDWNNSSYGGGSNSGDAQTLFLLGLGLTADGAEGAANLFQISNSGVKAAAVRNNLPTTQIDKIMGNTSKFATGAKWVGRGVIVVGAGISIYQGYDAYTQGDMTGVSKAGLDLGVGLGAAAIGGIPGVLLYGGYMLMMQPPHGGTGYQHPNVFLNDNTYVAPPFVPGF